MVISAAETVLGRGNCESFFLGNRSESGEYIVGLKGFPKRFQVNENDIGRRTLTLNENQS